MRLWVTRSQPGAERTAEALRARGHDPVVQPVLKAEALDTRLDLHGISALAFTSGHGVEAFAALNPGRDWPVFTTGDATAATARAAGFSDVQSAAGDAADLARLILSRPPPGPLLWPSAEEPARDLVALLGAEGVTAFRNPVYRTVMSDLTPPADIQGILIYSARAAEAVAQVLPKERASELALFALSTAAAKPLSGYQFHVWWANTLPEESTLLDLIPG
jgi:uroporphyrinogen-III synthase